MGDEGRLGPLMASRTLLLIDGYSLLFRSFYSTRFLSTTDGRPTNALFGFTGMLFTLIDRYQPESLVVCLDAHAPTFRHEEYAEYKGTRQETPNELVQQLHSCREYFDAIGIPWLERAGFEADDVIGTLSKQAESEGYRTLVVTGDSDTLQLVDDHVTIIMPKVGVSDVAEYDPAAVHARYGFGPELVPDYKALVGDSSDNIPGVPGIGDKSATKLITAFGSVEQIVARLDEVEEKFRKKLVPGLDQIPKSKWLATIVRDVPLDFDFTPFSVSEAQLEAGQQALTHWEFKNLAKRFPNVFGRYVGGGTRAVVQMVEARLEPKVGSGLESLDQMVKWAEGRPIALFWSESAAPTLLDDGPEREAFAAIGHEVRPLPAEIADAFFAADPGQCVLHDSKSHYPNGEMRSPRFDTFLAGYVLQPGRGQYPLRDLAAGYLDVLPPESNEQAVCALSLLHDAMSDRLVKEQQMEVLTRMELPLVPVLAEMERFGIQVSKPFLEDFSRSLQEEILVAEDRVFTEAGQKFLIGSPKQLGEVLFEKMELPGGKKTKTGWATGVEILQELVEDYPIARFVLRWRELTKLKSTYADALPRMIRGDGRIHTTLNQTVAATGRLSSNEPNLQNIPIRTELGRQIRKAFVAADGFQLASLDYSQIELRLLAELCQDDALVDAFQRRVDVHTVTAALMFHVPDDAVTKEQRRLAKMLNYAVLYGVTDFGLAQQLGEGFAVGEAKELIKQYFERFPKVKQYTTEIVEEARKKGYTATLMGRRRYFPDIHAQNRNERLYAERQAMNAPIQGAAADLVKLAMIDVRRKLGERGTRMLLQVHDELLFEWKPGDNEVLEAIRDTMEQAMPISIPIEVDAKVGPNWGEMTAVGHPS